jgi:hypothetical protein
MVSARASRRGIMGGLAMVGIGGAVWALRGPEPADESPASADLAAAFRRRPVVAPGEVTELTWADLVPEGEGAYQPMFEGMVWHGSATSAEQPASSGFRSEWNDRIVSLAGYVVPLEFTGTGVSEFILVPFVGACIHVPPPPANQLVLVSCDRPYENDKLFEPVRVTGQFGVAATSTGLAEIAYALLADKVEPVRR